MSVTKLNKKKKQSHSSTDLVRAYLHELGQVPLLDHYEEIIFGDNRDTELSAMLEGDEASPEDYATQQLMRQDVGKMLGELSPPERKVLSLRFGFEDGREWSLAKIAQELNLSRERVRQLQSQALARLRQKPHSALREYLAS